MKRLKQYKKRICLLLVFSLLVSGLSGCAAGNTNETNSASLSGGQAEEVIYQTKTDSYTKTETVYVTLDNAGAVQDISVTDWIHTDTAEVYLRDVTDLENVFNVKSNTEPYFKNGGLFWNMPTTDLYYRGTSTKPLPVSVCVRYYMNDIEMPASEIAGQSGRLRIEIEMINNLYTTQRVDGADVKIYNPIVCIGGMIMPETNFQNVCVEGGLAIGDGAKEIVAVAGMPGLNETLGLDKIGTKDTQLSFQERFEVTADVTDFSLSNMYFAAMPLSAVSGNIAVPTGVEDLKASLNQLKAIEAAIHTIDPNNMLAALMQNPEDIKSIASILADAVTLYEDNKVLIELISKYMTEENVAALQKLTSENAQVGQLISLLADPAVQRFLQIMPSASAELKDVLPLMGELAKDMEDPQVQAAVGNLPETAGRLAEIQSALESNQELISGLSTLLNQNNMTRITELIQALNTADFASMLEKYGVLTDNSDMLLERMSAMLEYGNSYKLYTQVEDGIQASVTFIMKTPVIKKQTSVQTGQTEASEKNWIQKLFGKN